jgi:hypothetical protein
LLSAPLLAPAFWASIVFYFAPAVYLFEKVFFRTLSKSFALVRHHFCYATSIILFIKLTDLLFSFGIFCLMKILGLDIFRALIILLPFSALLVGPFVGAFTVVLYHDLQMRKQKIDSLSVSDTKENKRVASRSRLYHLSRFLLMTVAFLLSFAAFVVGVVVGTGI